MYHDFSNHKESFDACTSDGLMSQYMFGDDMFVAPIVSPADENTLLASKKVWIPPGDWIEVDSGQSFVGPSFIEMKVSVSEMPRFVKAGAVIPQKLEKAGIGSAMESFDKLKFTIYKSGYTLESGMALVYEDDGSTIDYFTSDQFAEIRLNYKWNENDSLTVKFDVKGEWKNMPNEREIIVEIVNCPYSEDERIIYHGSKLTCSMKIDTDQIVNVFYFKSGGVGFTGLKGIIARANSAKSLLDEAQITPGSMTGGQMCEANLSKLASHGAVIQMNFEGKFLDDFEKSIDKRNVEVMVTKACEEMKELQRSKAKVGDATILRIERAIQLVC